MSQYRNGKIGLRWRTEKEVISGKGQFICGNKQCNEKDALASYEVNFSYFEAGENKQALVKLVACKRCAEKLVYKKQKEKKQLEKGYKEKHKRKRERIQSDDDDADNENHRSNDRRIKGRKASNTADDDGKNDSDENFEENFEEFLKGMFP